MMDDAFGHWFAGFFDGEGCLQICKPREHGRCWCQAAISLRADDRPILEEIQTRLGLGRISDERPRNLRGGEPFYASRWVVYRKVDCARLVGLFDRYPLRAKKAKDYAIWREAVIEWQAMRRTNHSVGPNDWSRMVQFYEALRDGRQFVLPGDDAAVADIPQLAQLSL